MKKILKRLANILFFILLSVVVIVFIIGKSESDLIKHRNTENDFSDVIRQSVNNNPRIVDFAMLGAHDVFSEKINKKSAIDPAEAGDSIIRNKIVAFFANGLFTRLSKAQYSSPEELFKKGVRYYDVRLSYYLDNWYTKHALISDKLEVYLKQLINSLRENPGEFIIFDMQHVYLENKSYEELFSYLGDISVNGTSILDFVHYDTSVISLADLKYNDVTRSGTKSGVIILAKTAVSTSNGKHYNYDESIRSTWHETNDKDTLLSGIRNEYQNINENNLDQDKLRVNQAQLTGLFSKDKIVKTLVGWSLLNMAEDFNASIINQDDLAEWFNAMPILMVDYADANKNKFNEQINLFIIEFNKKIE